MNKRVLAPAMAIAIAAGSVVTSDIPADSLAAGVPAQVKRSLIGTPLERDEVARRE